MIARRKMQMRNTEGLQTTIYHPEMSADLHWLNHAAIALLSATKGMLSRYHVGTFLRR